jgi:hypothetical protein
MAGGERIHTIATLCPQSQRAKKNLYKGGPHTLPHLLVQSAAFRITTNFSFDNHALQTSHLFGHDVRYGEQRYCFCHSAYHPSRAQRRGLYPVSHDTNGTSERVQLRRVAML